MNVAMTSMLNKGNGLLTAEVDLPDRFDMKPKSVAGRLAALSFYTDNPSREAMTQVLAGLHGFLDVGDRAGLSEESVCFRTAEGPREKSISISPAIISCSAHVAVSGSSRAVMSRMWHVPWPC